MVKVRYLKKYLTLFTILFLISCSNVSTYKKHYALINSKIAANDFNGAIEVLQNTKNTHYKKKDRVLYYLDMGLLYHYNKDYEKSNEMLSQAENAMEDLFTKSVSKAAASLLLNDNILDYAGEDYENIYLNIIKALNFIHLNNKEDAFVEIRKLNEKLAYLEDKYAKYSKNLNKSKKGKAKFKPGKNPFKDSALARIFSMLLYRSDGKIDDASIDLIKMKNVWKTEPVIYDFKPVSTNKLLSKDTKLDIFCLAGKSPDKKANTLYIHTEKDLLVIADSKENRSGIQKLNNVNTIPWSGMTKGYHFKFQLPYITKTKSKVKSIRVIVENKGELSPDLLESIENTAVNTYKIKEPIVYIKTITRAVLKGLIAQQQKANLEKKIDNPLLGFAMRAAVDVAVDATENADLRISHYFPSKVFFSEIPILPGNYKITINYLDENNNIIYSDIKENVEIKKNGLNLTESYYLQ